MSDFFFTLFIIIVIVSIVSSRRRARRRRVAEAVRVPAIEPEVTTDVIVTAVEDTERAAHVLARVTGIEPVTARAMLSTLPARVRLAGNHVGQQLAELSQAGVVVGGSATASTTSPAAALSLDGGDPPDAGETLPDESATDRETDVGNSDPPPPDDPVIAFPDTVDDAVAAALGETDRARSARLLRSASLNGLTGADAALGSKLLEWGKLSEAEGVLRGAARHDGVAANNLGVVLELEGRSRDAREAYQHAVKLGNTEAEVNLDRLRIWEG